MQVTPKHNNVDQVRSTIKQNEHISKIRHI